MSNLICDNVRPDGNGFTVLHQLRPDGVTIVETADGRISAVTQGAAASLRVTRATPTLGQVTFPLPEALANVLVFVNGMAQRPSEDFLLTSDALLWISSQFSLGSTDLVEIWY